MSQDTLIPHIDGLLVLISIQNHDSALAFQETI